jgi:hypothetical protein
MKRCLIKTWKRIGFPGFDEEALLKIKTKRGIDSVGFVRLSVF